MALGCNFFLTPAASIKVRIVCQLINSVLQAWRNFKFARSGPLGAGDSEENELFTIHISVASSTPDDRLR